MAVFRSAVLQWSAGNAEEAATAADLAAGLPVTTVVLVEGVSDQVAVETLCARRGLDLPAEGICVLPLGGATNAGRFLELVGPPGLGIRLAGLCDAGEERFFRRGLERVGVGTELTRADMEGLGFFICEEDLEAELIRTVGVAAVERVVEQQGDGKSLRILQRQPAQRSWTAEQQLRRFIGSIGGRKARYGRALIEALGDSPAPRPLELLVAHLRQQRLVSDAETHAS